MVDEHNLPPARGPRAPRQPGARSETTGGLRPAHRSVQHVVYDHLRKHKEGLIQEDLAQNYAEEVILMTSTGIYRGHPGVVEADEDLRSSLPGIQITYHTILVEGEFAYLEWTGRAEEGDIVWGADSFVVRGGKIVAQTSHHRFNGEESSRDDL